MADKVLIIDDDVQTLRLVGLMLERQGYKILAASNGTQAIQLAHSERPDIIVLDVMMPDMDGYEVTRRLRKDPETANIPILLFTAKTQVEDKVTGYEAGADDYLTKPIHPAELTAHLRALLARSKTRGASTKDRGYVIGVVAPKGGLGVSTIALNLGIAFHHRTRTEVIAAEVRPGQGTWMTELAANTAEGLTSLLRMRAADISTDDLENYLFRIPAGIRLLVASHRAKDAELMHATEQLEAVIELLPLHARLVLLDIGTPFLPGYEMLLNHCNEVMLVTEPFPGTIQRTKAMIEDLGTRGFGRSKLLTLLSNNRVRADVQLSIVQMQDLLGYQITQVFPPAPEVAFQAGSRAIPFIQVQSSGVVNQQFASLAERMIQRVGA